MVIAIDESPLKTGNYLSHRVRGTGFYLTNLRKSLEKYFPKNEYIFFAQNEKIKHKVDITHFPYFEPFFRTLPFDMPKNSVVTVHDMTPFVFPKHFPAGLKGKVRWQIQKMNLKKASAIITDSESSKKDISKFGGISEDKIFVIYLAAGEHFRKLKTENLKLRTKYNLPEKFALYVGDITWNKNLPNLIAAINKTKIPLVVVGKTFLNTDYDKVNPWNQSISESQRLAKENPRVTGLGFVTDEDLVKLYNLATVFVMPSFYEGFGLPIVEAMQSGCPVITTKGGSIPEIAGDAVYYVDPNDVASIEEGIKKVFNDEKIQEELSLKGLKQASKFTWQETANQTMKVYEKIAQV